MQSRNPPASRRCLEKGHKVPELPRQAQTTHQQRRLLQPAAALREGCGEQRMASQSSDEASALGAGTEDDEVDLEVRRRVGEGSSVTAVL